VAALELTSSKAEVTVPPLIGQPEAAAVHKLKALGLVPNVSQGPSITQAVGDVVSQNPQVGTVAQKGARVYLTISTGPGNVAVPNVLGMSEPHAIGLLRGRGLDPLVQAQSSRNVTAGDVIATSPSAGTVVLQGTSVTVSVSSGPPGGGGGGGGVALVRVPNVTGGTLHAAEEALVAARLTVGTVSRRSSSGQPPGTIISQLPVSGVSLAPGGAVNLVIAEAPHVSRKVEVPNVLGKNQTAAAAALGAAGLTPASVSRTVTHAAENGIVLEENPPAGQTVRRGATITITIGALAERTVTTTTTAATESAGAAHP
jgi:serine/threonine-protein kinase